MDCVSDHPETETIVSEEEKAARKAVPINALCNSYGWTAVKAFLDNDIKNPRVIHRLILASRKDTQRDGALVLHTTKPTQTMVRASMDAVLPGDYAISKEKKHEMRLTAALDAEKAKRS
jgi:hypothetical protein